VEAHPGPSAAAALLATAALLVGLASPAPITAADATPPVAGPPSATPRLGVRVTSLDPFTISWPAAGDQGGSGIAAYQLRQSVDGGSWQPVKLPSPTARNVALGLRPPHHYQFAVRAIDRAGNVGAWATAAAFRQRRVSESTADLERSTGWAYRRSTGYLGGGGLRSGTAGATATVRFTGSQVAWIAPRSSSRGSAEVSVDGVPITTVSLYRPTAATRQIVFRWAWPESGPHSLGIRVLGTPGHPFVDIDGLVIVDEPPADPTLVGAGDVAYCSLPGDESTAALLDRIPGTIFVAGDLAYPDGTAGQFRDCYGPTWGRWRLRTFPTPGNHEYHTAGAAPYFAYFGARAGAAGKGWYAYDLGSWRIYSLNSSCSAVGGCGAGSEQERWLRADLAANPRACVAAVWHHPLFSSGAHGNNLQVQALWTALQDAGAELVLNGHDHDYERFAPQTPAGVADAGGIRQFVIGTGGASLRPFSTVRANSERRDASTHGVLQLTLRADGYDWLFVPVAGGTFRDSGAGTCH
jgi:hypothetical protein